MKNYVKLILGTLMLTGTTLSAPAVLAQANGAGGWKLGAETGSCLIEKGLDNGSKFQMTSRGRILLSTPQMPDLNFRNGDDAQLNLTWSDGINETVTARMLSIPGGGSQNLSDRQVYVLTYDTRSFATAHPNGFTLEVRRDGVIVYSFDGRDSGDYLAAFEQCAKNSFIKREVPR